jgi:uncharacterized tellurite resistance protein B-like protein
VAGVTLRIIRSVGATNSKRPGRNGSACWTLRAGRVARDVHAHPRQRLFMPSSEVSMQHVTADSPEALARVVAMVMVADTELDPREVGVLDELDAFARLGITRGEFMRQARLYCAGLGQRMGARGWLRLSDVELIDGVLAGVRDPAKRLLVARLAAGVITADGRVQDIERLVFDHLLARWSLTRSEVSRAILNDRRRAVEA